MKSIILPILATAVAADIQVSPESILTSTNLPTAISTNIAVKNNGATEESVTVALNTDITQKTWDHLTGTMSLTEFTTFWNEQNPTASTFSVLGAEPSQTTTLASQITASEVKLESRDNDYELDLHTIEDKEEEINPPLMFQRREAARERKHRNFDRKHKVTGKKKKQLDDLRTERKKNRKRFHEENITQQPRIMIIHNNNPDANNNRRLSAENKELRKRLKNGKHRVKELNNMPVDIISFNRNTSVAEQQEILNLYTKGKNVTWEYDGVVDALEDGDLLAGDVDDTVAGSAFTTDDTYISNLYGMRMIKADKLWENNITGLNKEKKDRPIVAVIDTGVSPHVELQGQFWENAVEVAKGDNKVDDDQNGYVDDKYGYNFYAGNNNVVDDNSHGTHVAGIISALGGNGAGIAGVLWGSHIMPLKFLDSTSVGRVSDGILAMYYAIENGAKVINNSWGGPGDSVALKIVMQAAVDKNVLVICAAGNNAINFDTSEGDYPAMVDAPNVISVASVGSGGLLSNFSAYGKNSVDIAAPGEGILSLSNSSTNDQYILKSGTSMATPHVVGTAAMLYAQFPNVPYNVVRDALLTTSTKLTIGPNKREIKGGLLNAWEAYLYVVNYYLQQRIFFLPNVNGPLFVAANSSSDVEVKFNPSQEGIYSTTLTVTGTDGTVSRSVAGVAFGKAQFTSNTATKMSLDVGKTATISITNTNNGTTGGVLALKLKEVPSFASVKTNTLTLTTNSDTILTIPKGYTAASAFVVSCDSEGENGVLSFVSNSGSFANTVLNTVHAYEITCVDPSTTTTTTKNQGNNDGEDGTVNGKYFLDDNFVRIPGHAIHQHNDYIVQLPENTPVEYCAQKCVNDYPNCQSFEYQIYNRVCKFSSLNNITAGTDFIATHHGLTDLYVKKN